MSRSVAWLDNYVEQVDRVEPTYYVGGIYEMWRLGAQSRETLHYLWNGRPVAVRVRVRWFGSPEVKDSLSFLHADHLGSTALVTSMRGDRQAEERYKPFGEVRWQSGQSEGLPTDRTFTGQRAETGLGSLMDYGARMYSPVLGRFLSADSIVPEPGNPQAFNRYAYTYNNPLNLIDPSGHEGCAAGDDWCWNNRWYQAHGKYWDTDNGGWRVGQVLTCSAITLINV